MPHGFACSIELQMVSSIAYAGTTFKPQGWAVLNSDDGGTQLVFMASILQVCVVGGLALTGAVGLFVQTFRFTFTQLGITQEANRLTVPTPRMQDLVDRACDIVDVVDFIPPRCHVRGCWASSVERFEDLAANSTLFRSVHLGSSSPEELVFITR